jgi:hypothetical protein
MKMPPIKLVKLHRSVSVAFILLIVLFLVHLSYKLVTVPQNTFEISVYKTEQPKFRNWFDLEQVSRDASRTGLGENGSHVYLTDPGEIELNERLYQETGFSVVISDKISVNRSVPLIVHPNCFNFEYFAKLPKTSVIVIFHNEVKSVLLRTIHSIFNRTPPELLHEIILVNDNSFNVELYEPLQKYVAKNFAGKVKIINLGVRHGLIRTRLKGARKATGEVLVVNWFNSHRPINSEVSVLVFRFSCRSSAELAATATPTDRREPENCYSPNR